MEAGEGGFKQKKKKITVDYRSLIYCLQHSKKKKADFVSTLSREV